MLGRQSQGSTFDDLDRLMMQREEENREAVNVWSYGKERTR